MPVDFDRLVTKAQFGSFAVLVGVTHLDGSAETRRGIFDDDHQFVDADGMGHSTQAPVLSIRRSEFEKVPTQGATIEILEGEHFGRRFRVTDEQAETDGETMVILEEVLTG